MEKKGQIFHWILLGVLVGIGIVLFSTIKLSAEIGEKGIWQSNFLKGPFTEAETELLRNDWAAQKTGLIIADLLAQKGGFKDESPCGMLSGTHFWNKKEKFCFPSLNEDLTGLFNQEFNKILSQRTFYGISFKDYYLYGQGEKIVVEEYLQNFQRYTYDTSFSVNLGYSFEEYDPLKKEALNLVIKCTNAKELEPCLNQNKPDHWKYGSCEKPEFPKGERQIPFCVESPHKVILSIKGVQKLITYHLALDFTSEIPFSPEKPIIEFDAAQNLVKISFNQEEADSYQIYYTNWLQVKGKIGGSEEIFSTMPDLLGFFQKSVVIDNPKTEDCPTEKESGKVYLCNQEIVYWLKDENLVSEKNYLLAITSVKEGKESWITEFTEVS